MQARRAAAFSSCPPLEWGRDAVPHPESRLQTCPQATTHWGQGPVSSPPFLPAGLGEGVHYRKRILRTQRPWMRGHRYGGQGEHRDQGPRGHRPGVGGQRDLGQGGHRDWGQGVHRDHGQGGHRPWVGAHNGCGSGPGMGGGGKCGVCWGQQGVPPDNLAQSVRHRDWLGVLSLGVQLWGATRAPPRRWRP